jgi:hypothetical protein
MAHIKAGNLVDHHDSFGQDEPAQGGALHEAQSQQFERGTTL